MERPLPRSGDWVDTATVSRGRASTITTRRTRNGDHQLATRGDLNWPPVGTFPWPRTFTLTLADAATAAGSSFLQASASSVVAYALSPIDLIPDFIPVLGYLDDVILVPIGIYFTLKLIPPPVIEQCRTQARNWIDERQARPRNYVAAAVIVLLWLGALWLAWRWASPYLQGA